MNSFLLRTMLHWRSHSPFLNFRSLQKFATNFNQVRGRKLYVRRLRWAMAGLALSMLLPMVAPPFVPMALAPAEAQSGGGAIQLKASRVEANSNTGIVTAVGNVRIDYPTREIFATAAQAQYYSREQRIVLSGNVDVMQEGNTLQAETVTYLIEEGRFVATPAADRQVEAVYLLPDDASLATETAPESEVPQAPLSIPTPPDELPDDLSLLNIEN